MADNQRKKAANKRKRTGRKPAKLPVKQGEYEAEVGNKKPPKEHQFKPGQSGNPKGPPKHHVQLWTYICGYMAMTNEQLKRVENKKHRLSLSQQWALRIAKGTQRLGFTTLDRFARYVIDRDEGRATEHVVLGEESILTDEQCEEIRMILRERIEKG